MKILRRGIPPEQRIHIVSCRVCDSQIELAETEATQHEDQREGIHFSIGCPVCSHTIIFYPERKRPPPPAVRGY